MTKLKKPLLERVRVLQPCAAKWDEMTAQSNVEARRSCEHCEREVYDLSRMTRAAAEDFIRNAKGRACVRLVKDARGRVVTKENYSASEVRKSTGEHRWSVTAKTTALSIVLTITVTACTNHESDTRTTDTQPIQAASTVEVKTIQDESKVEVKDNKSKVEGVVYDSLNEAIVKAKVKLTSKQSGKIYKAVTDSEGRYCFDELSEGRYKIEVEAKGFKRFEKDAVLVLNGRNRIFNAKFDLGHSDIVGSYILYSPAHELALHLNEKIIERRSKKYDASEYIDFALISFLSAAGSEHLVDRLKEILQQDMNVNVANEYGETALMFAASKSGASVELLLEAKANVNARTKFGVTPLMFAALNEDANVARLILQNGAEITRATLTGGHR